MTDDLLSFDNDEDDLLDFGEPTEELFLSRSKRYYQCAHASTFMMMVNMGESTDLEDYLQEIKHYPNDNDCDDTLADHTLKETFFYWLVKHREANKGKKPRRLQTGVYTPENPLYASWALSALHKLRINAQALVVHYKGKSYTCEVIRTSENCDAVYLTTKPIVNATGDKLSPLVWFDSRSGFPILPDEKQGTKFRLLMKE